MCSYGLISKLNFNECISIQLVIALLIILSWHSDVVHLDDKYENNIQSSIFFVYVNISHHLFLKSLWPFSYLVRIIYLPVHGLQLIWNDKKLEHKMRFSSRFFYRINKWDSWDQCLIKATLLLFVVAQFAGIITACLFCLHVVTYMAAWLKN